MALVTSEDTEQAIVVEYCRLTNIPLFHVPNSTYTKSFKQKAKNKRLGVSSGVPDLFLIVNNRLIAIEMKRTKGGVVTKTQLDWLKRLNKAGIEAIVAKGAEQAIEFINKVKGYDESS
jgi:uncharacterized protein (DUF1015 family)